ncbi:hypothetical protein K438DRAFT_1855959 [Mycena galopus ATCC 62051]|nr:hypothetical protein K438DRAFT_1855959 [Mycena galopus ATCC 62051]
MAPPSTPAIAMSSAMNILNIALYDLFCADGTELEVLRMGCCKYFERGGESVLNLHLHLHPRSVAMYSIWVLFTHPRRVPGRGKPRYSVARLEEYPFLLIKAVRVFYTPCFVFGPLLWLKMFKHAVEYYRVVPPY